MSGRDYDTADRLFEMFENGTTTLLATIGPDEQGRRDWITRNGGAATDYEYDPISRLEILTHDLDGTGTAVNDAGFGFTFNPASQIITRVQINEAYEFPLTPDVDSYVVNGRNQYTQVGGTTHGWDPNGNLTSDGLTTFGYDTENRLVSASGAKNASLSYDPLGRLYQVTSGANTTRFVYDGDRLIAEYNGSGTLQRRYVHGSGVDEPLVWYEGAAVSSATRRYLHADHQGSIVAASLPSGAMQQVRSYDAYGVTSSSNTLRFQYTGQAAIPEVGLLYYKARFYNPALGRFMQTDPIGYEDDNNLYAYVGNDPLNRIDPTGTCDTGSRIDDINVPECKTLNEAVDTSRDEDESRDETQQEESAPQSEQGGTQEETWQDTLTTPWGGWDNFKQDLACVINCDMPGDGSFESLIVSVGPINATSFKVVDSTVTQTAAYLGNALGPAGSIFGRTALGGSSLLGINSNSALRIGWGWRGTSTNGTSVFRISGQWVERLGVKSGHIDLFTWP